MINIKQIKYEINPIEYNFSKTLNQWRGVSCTAWQGLSELDSIPSLFIQHGLCQIALPIKDLQTLLAMPIVQQLLDEAETRTAK